MKDKYLLTVSFFILLGLLVYLITWRFVNTDNAKAGYVAAPLVATTPAPTSTANQVQPAIVATVEKGETTYMYRLDEFRHAIWRVAGEIPSGALVKRSGCWADGFAQVEYRDPSRPNRWLVQFVKCEGK
ncbi:MAG TPA: hypothetical protein VN364_08225 [Bellilinea sp.]|nr:hypothetical protein [Bellilinea sp.]